MKYFQSQKIYLCDFHREQCWQRWIRNSKHGLKAGDSDLLLSLLRKMTFAEACDDTGCHFDKNYREAEAQLKRSEVRTANAKVRAWLAGKCLTIPDVGVCMLPMYIYIYIHTFFWKEKEEIE